MLTEYTDYYSEASEVFSKYGSTLADVSFNGQRQALEVYCLTAISLCESHARAVSILLKNNCAVEPIILMRGVFEIFCDFCWISQAGSLAERNERVFRLEANPFREITKEVRLIEQDLQSPNPVWKTAQYEEMKRLLDDTAQRQPWLLKSPSSDPLDFQNAPNLVDRIGPDIRIRFYHLYRFSSAFTHPNPMLKSVFLNISGRELSSDEKIEQPLENFLGHGLLFFKSILNFSQQVFAEYDIERQALRTQLYQSLSHVVEKGKRGYSIRDAGASDATQSPT